MTQPVQPDLTPAARRALLARLLRQVADRAGHLSTAIEAGTPPPGQPPGDLDLIEIAAADLWREAADAQHEHAQGGERDELANAERLADSRG